MMPKYRRGMGNMNQGPGRPPTSSKTGKNIFIHCFNLKFHFHYNFITCKLFKDMTLYLLFF
jgi:hypothetical protein